MRLALRHRFQSASALIAMIVLIGCGQDDNTAPAADRYPFQVRPRPSQTVPPDIIKLVPRSASGLVVAPEPRRLQAELARIAKAIAPGLDKLIDVVPLVSNFGLRPRDLDLGRPGAIVLLTMPMFGGSLPMFALPVKDAAEAADLVEGQATVSGQYLAIGIGEAPKLARKPSTLADAFPAGDLGIRLNLLRVLQPLRQMISEALDPASLLELQGGPDINPTALQQLSVVLGGLKGLLGTARTLDISASFQDGAVDLDFKLGVAKGGSWDQGTAQPSGEIVHFARSLPILDPSILVLSTPVWSKWMDAFRGAYQAEADRMDPAQRQAFADIVNRSKAIYDMLKVGMAGAVKLRATGVDAPAIFASNTPQPLVEQFHLLCEQLDSGSVASPPKTEQGAPAVTTRIVTIQEADLSAAAKGLQLPEALADQVSDALVASLANKPLELAIGVDQGRVGVLAGGAVAAAAQMFSSLRADQASETGLLAEVLPRLHATPEFLIACDVAQTLRDLRSYLGEAAGQALPIPPDGEPIFVWLAVSSSGRHYEAQLHVDLVKLLALFE